MKLIADSGSTKTDWIATKNSKRVHTAHTKGINPFYQTATEIAEILQTELLPQIAGFTPTSIYFYGAGCSFPEKKMSIQNAFLSVFGELPKLHLATDLLAAVHALCGNKEGIACILGTGSNSCYWDGKRIVKNVSPLGYILGDEGSGAVLGKLLIADLLKNQLPQHLTNSFFQKYETNYETLMAQVYRQAFPNRKLAQYTYFIAENLNEPAIYRIVENSFTAFVKRNLAQYPQKLPVHFVGSVAVTFEEVLKKVLSKENYHLGTLLKSPIENLVKYHTS